MCLIHKFNVGYSFLFMMHYLLDATFSVEDTEDQLN